MAAIINIETTQLEQNNILLLGNSQIYGDNCSKPVCH